MRSSVDALELRLFDWSIIVQICELRMASGSQHLVGDSSHRRLIELGVQLLVVVTEASFKQKAGWSASESIW